MPFSSLTSYTPIPEGSAATPGLWDARFSALQANVAQVNSDFSRSIATSALSGTANQIVAVASGSTLTFGLASPLLPPGTILQGAGSALAPSYAFSSESSLGLYNSAASTLALSYGTLQAPSNITFGGVALGPAGSAAAPTWAFQSEKSLGLFRSQASVIALSYGVLSFGTASSVTNAAAVFVSVANTTPAAQAPIVIVNDNAGGAGNKISLSNAVLAYGYGTGGNDPSFVGIRSRGSQGSPTAVQTDDVLADFDGGGQYDTTIGHVYETAGLFFRAAENWSATSAGAYAALYVTASGNTVGQFTYRWDQNAFYPSFATPSLGTQSKPWGDIWFASGAVTGHIYAATDVNLGSSSANNVVILRGGSGVAKFTATDFSPVSAGGLTLGTTAVPWGPIIFQQGSSTGSAKASGVIYQNVELTTGSTTDVSLASFPLPANALAQNGHQLRIKAFGFAGSSNCTVHFKFGATDLVNVSVTNGQAWDFESQIARIGAAAQVTSSKLFNSSPALQSFAEQAPTETMSSVVTVDIRGSAAAGTLTVHSVTAEILEV